MNHRALIEILQNLRDQPAETEVFEFKEAKHNFDFGKLGRYFSALSNEANLKTKPCAWLVFGIENRSHEIVGSRFRPERKDLDSLKEEIANRTTNRITFQEIHELNLPEGRIVMFQIPAAPRGIPVAFEGHYYGRDGEALSPLNLEEIERIRSQGIVDDWSAGIVPDANLADLDPKAISYAREKFLVKFPEHVDNISRWDDFTFLNKAKITIKGKITRTAIVLLGKSESEHYLSPSIAKIRWILRTVTNEDKDYDIFPPPLLLAIDKVYDKIRNLKYRYLPTGTLFPNELPRYEPFNIREAINNCVAHNDYTKGGFINVVEFEDDHLVFSNKGHFIPGSVERVIQDDAPEEHYRNRFLAEAMFQLGLVDTRGGGIRKIFLNQIKRFFPLPDYELEADRTKMILTGKILNEQFGEILSNNPNISISDVLLLDRVQKNKSLTEEGYQYLRKMGFVEGRKPNFFLSAKIVESLDDETLKTQYIDNRSFDDQHFKKMIVEYIKTFGSAKRSAIDRLIIPKLSTVLSDKQKKYKVGNLLASLREEGKIRSTSYATWEIIV